MNSPGKRDALVQLIGTATSHMPARTRPADSAVLVLRFSTSLALTAKFHRPLVGAPAVHPRTNAFAEILAHAAMVQRETETPSDSQGISAVLAFDPAEVERVAALRAKKTETPK